MKRWKKYLLVILLFAVSMAAGFTAAIRSPEIQGEAISAQTTEEAFITLTTKLEKRYRYKLCGHVLTEETEMPAMYVGLNKQELRGQLSGVSITQFTKDLVILTEQYDHYCPQHLLVYLQGEYLKVYQTKAYTGEAEQIERFWVQTQEIPAEEQRALNAGKVFAEMEEIRQYVSRYQERVAK